MAIASNSTMQPHNGQPLDASRQESTPPRVGVVVVVREAGRFLMIRRADHLLAGGAWCFVGGGIEPGESQSQAVVREFAEEVGGAARPVRKIWEYLRPDGNLLLHWWLADLIDGALEPNHHEVSEIRWCTLDEIAGLPNVLESNREFLAQFGRALLTPGLGAS